jgi:hypothetical protein
MKAIQKVNIYFFGKSELSISDVIWFYGFYAFSIAILVLTLRVTW